MLLDSNFKLWLLEVNKFPSVGLPTYGASSVEFTHNTLAEALNIARIHLPKQVARHYSRKLNNPKLLNYASNKKLYHMDHSREEIERQNQLLNYAIAKGEKSRRELITSEFES